MVHLTCPSSLGVPYVGVCSQGLDQMLSSPHVQFASARWKQTPACPFGLCCGICIYRINSRQPLQLATPWSLCSIWLPPACLPLSKREGVWCKWSRQGAAGRGVCVTTFVWRLRAARSPPHQLSLHDDTGPDTGYLCEHNSHNQLFSAASSLPHYHALDVVCNTRCLILQVCHFWPSKKDWFKLTITLGKLPFFCWCFLSVVVDVQQRSGMYTELFFRKRKWERYQ